MNYAESTQWKFPGKQFAFRNCEDASTFVAIGDWQQALTKEEIEQFAVEYEEHQNSLLYFDTGLGFRLKTDDATQAELTKLVTLLDQMVAAGQAQDNVSLHADGEIRTISFSQFKSMIIAYGLQCYNIKMST